MWMDCWISQMPRQVPIRGVDLAIFWNEDGKDEYFVHGQLFNEDQTIYVQLSFRTYQKDLSD